ncbi:hypothetical protein [Levilinea saccharolytica]|uniref:Uncharacterized protein n=1 Tax=Levilinea saccharolytica TaxID=229921 RepID=A0A0P6Y9L2_9CHLR|nr:hypothetical protein [Levilinea saccharolytica]KPL78476.1 hypothetical protein ADN01_14865 [Levilinea saccharolytica]GAP18489.1 hypothetical protein LSAC_02385 [Levilinea saccharolytica]
MTQEEQPDVQPMEEPIQPAAPKAALRPKNADGLWNVLTVLGLLGLAAMLTVAGLIYWNPYVPFNPYPPPTLPAPLVLPSATPTIPALPPTWTPTVTLTTAPTDTPVPPTPTATLIGMGPTATPTATEPVNTVYAFALQSPPAMISATILYPERSSCDWMGVGGQVLDMQGGPAVGISVQVGGSLEGYALTLYPSLTGTALKYGAAGYEVTLNNRPVASQGKLWIQLIDQQRLPLSSRVYFDTSGDCEKNLVVINFKQVR